MGVWRCPGHREERVGHNVWVETRRMLEDSKLSLIRVGVSRSQDTKSFIIQGVESRLYSTLKVYKSP